MSWAEEELSGLDLRDKRLNKRCIKVLETLSQSPQGSLPSVCKSWSETLSSYRLFTNEKVTARKVIRPHLESTKRRAKEEKIVLCLQDTTELDYSNHKTKQGIGPLNSESHLGLLFHPTLVVTPEQLCLGLLDDFSWYRETLDKEKKHHNRALEDKESYRWLESYRHSQKLAEALPETTVINISDREGDIYEIFLEHQNMQSKPRCEYIIRSAQNRCVKHQDEELPLKLWESVGQSPILGYVEFDTPAGRGKKSRHVTQSLQAVEITLECPQSRRPRAKLPSVKVTAVLATEVETPEGEEPVTWLLLTSLKVDSFDTAYQIIKYYLCRWQIERFFLVLKQGCKVEELHLRDELNLNICLRFYMIIAWRVLYLTFLGRVAPQLSCNAVFEDYEWKAIYVFVKRQPPPDKPPSLNEMIRLVASLGGFLNRKADKEPGIKVMWIGLQRSMDITQAWIAFNQIKFEHTYV